MDRRESGPPAGPAGPGETSVPPMRAGVSSFAFGWAVQRHARPRPLPADSLAHRPPGAGDDPPFDERALIAFARRHGVPVVQLGDNVAAHAMTPERLSAFVAAADAAGVEIELGARLLTRAHLDTYLALCGCCRSRLLRFVVDGSGYEPSADLVIGLLKDAAPALESAGVTLAIENHDRWPVAALRGMIEAVGSPAVGACLDTANSLGAGEGLSEVLRELAAVTVNLHVKDVAIIRFPHMMGFTVEGRALGRGQLALREAIARVAAESGGRCRTVVLESWTPPVVPAAAAGALPAAASLPGVAASAAAIDPAMRATIETELAWAAEGITTLKDWLAPPFTSDRG